MFDYIDSGARMEAAVEIYRASLRSDFYRRKYEGRLEPCGYDSWTALPFLTRAEIYGNTFPHSHEMLTMPFENMIVISTGGSSGTARYTAYTHQEWDLFCDIQAKVMKTFGVRPDDRVANLFIAGRMWPSFLGLHETIKRIGAVHLPISSNIAPEEIFDMCVEFDATVIVSLPTLFVFMADLARKTGKKIPSLRMINYAGEQLSAEAEKHIRESLGVHDIRAAAYTSADAGLMGYPCKYCENGIYHVPTAFQLLEIVDADTGAAVDDGERGAIVVTNLGRKSFPVIRYLIGDDAMMIPGACGCGDLNPRFKLLGRSGADFKLGGGFISMDEFDRALSETGPEFSLNYNLEIVDTANQVELTLNVEAPDAAKAETLKNRLHEAVLARIKEFKIGLQLGYIKKFEIRIAALGSLERNERTGKIKKLIDRRIV